MNIRFEFHDSIRRDRRGNGGDGSLLGPALVRRFFFPALLNNIYNFSLENKKN